MSTKPCQTSLLVQVVLSALIGAVVGLVVTGHKTSARLDRIERALSLEPRGAGEER